MNDAAQIIIAVGTAAAAIIGALASVFASINSRTNSKKIDEVAETINGTQKIALSAAEDIAHTKGVIEGRRRELAERPTPP